MTLKDKVIDSLTITIDHHGDKLVENQIVVHQGLKVGDKCYVLKTLIIVEEVANCDYKNHDHKDLRLIEFVDGIPVLDDLGRVGE